MCLFLVRRSVFSLRRVGRKAPAFRIQYIIWKTGSPSNCEFIQKAIRLNALDYIDKPVDPVELDAALIKAFHLQQTSKTIPETNKLTKRFCLPTDSDERFVDADEIICFESSKRYSRVFFVDGTNKVVRYNLVNLSKILPSNSFIHISRQFIVNVFYIKYISKCNKTITLRQGNKELIVKKVFPKIILELIDNHILK